MANEGNQWWKLRSKHGRDTLFATPELMWEAACEYFEWCDANPWYKYEQTRGNGKFVEEEGGELTLNTPALTKIPLGRPYTKEGLCLYLGCSVGYLKDFKLQHKDKTDFLAVIHQIEQVIYKQKFEGASIGAFNANIIARDLGLADKQELTGKDGDKLMPDKSDDELKQQLSAVLSKLNADTNPQS